MADVFISYNQSERALVAPIADRLNELGVDLWFDQKISAGESFGAVIRARLKEAKAVLVCWSPAALESQWIDAEADYAREVGTYVPIFIAPCALMPPFNRIHTDDLSTWNGLASDPTWLKLVERIAKLLGRDGLAEAAKAQALGDDQALYAFARRYPSEATALRIWKTAEARHRKEFESRLEEAQVASASRAARASAEAADLEERIKASATVFESWLVEERCGGAVGPKPDPMAMVKRYISNEEKRLRDEVAALSSALAQAKATEEELEAAQTEIARLSQLSETTDKEIALLRDQIASHSSPDHKAKEFHENLSSTEEEVVGFPKEVIVNVNADYKISRSSESSPLVNKVIDKEFDRSSIIDKTDNSKTDSYVYAEYQEVSNFWVLIAGSGALIGLVLCALLSLR
jgi:hypothetical protein